MTPVRRARATQRRRSASARMLHDLGALEDAEAADALEAMAEDARDAQPSSDVLSRDGRELRTSLPAEARVAADGGGQLWSQGWSLANARHTILDTTNGRIKVVHADQTSRYGGRTTASVPVDGPGGGASAGRAQDGFKGQRIWRDGSYTAYASGLFMHDDGTLVLSYGSGDIAARVKLVDMNQVEELFAGQPDRCLDD